MCWASSCLLALVIITVLATVNLAVVAATTHVALHVSDVVVFRNVAVFLHIRALVRRHMRDKILDDFVWHEGMSEIELGDVFLVTSLPNMQVPQVSGE